MIYLLIGEDTAAKTKQIAQLKSQYLPSSESLNFDFETLYGHKLAADDLKKALITLPVLSMKRLVIVRQAEKLKAPQADIILAYSRLAEPPTVLILDADSGQESNSTLKNLTSVARVLRFQAETKKNVFDMTRAMGEGNCPAALSILHGLLEEGVHPLQIFGGLLWYWGKQESRLGSQKYKAGLLRLQEADLNIKRSRIEPEFAIETLLVKLNQL